MGAAKILSYGLVLSCLVGLGLSIYSYVIELEIERNENYVATCDISEHMSCTKAFKSEYGKGFGIVGKVLGKDSALNKPNSLLGIIFYSFLASVAHTNSELINATALIATILSNCASLYFAYILMFVLHDFCIVCVSIYIVNFVNLVLIYKKLLRIKEETEKAKPKQN